MQVSKVQGNVSRETVHSHKSIPGGLDLRADYRVSYVLILKETSKQ